MKRFVMYTARFGKPGRLREHKNSMSDVDRIYYTDIDVKEGCHQMIPISGGEKTKNDFYNVKRINLNHISLPIKRQRFIKICIPDEIFNNYEYSVYADIKRPAHVDFDRWLSYLDDDSDFLVRLHPQRGCAYDEGRWLIKKDRYDTEDIKKQLNFYKKEGFPAQNELYHTVQLIRRHTKRLKEFSRLWWEQVERFSYRDQVSLPYAIWKFGMKISVFPGFRGRRRK